MSTKRKTLHLKRHHVSDGKHPSEWKNQLMIAIPFAELGYSRFWQMLLTVEHLGWHIDNGRVVTMTGPYLPDNHIRLVKEALEKPGWDTLLFLEHDHIFQRELLSRVAAYDKPIVSGIYVSRSDTDTQPVAYKWDTARVNILRYQPYEWDEKIRNRGLYEVDVVPMGCTAIRRDVLESWPKDTPMFHAQSMINGPTMSDDVWFCRKAQDQGWPIHIDTANVVQHLSLIALDDRHYVGWVKAMAAAGNTGRVEEAS